MEAVNNLLLPSDIKNVVESFHVIIDSMNERDKGIIKRRYGLDGMEKFTLEEISHYYDITKERVRQIKSKKIKKIFSHLDGQTTKKTIKKKEVGGITYRHALTYRQIIAAFQKEGDILLDGDIDRIFQGNLIYFKKGYLNLFMNIASYFSMPRKPEKYKGSLHHCWQKKSWMSRNEVNGLFSLLNGVFMEVDPISAFKFTAKIKNKARVSNEIIKKILQATNEVEFFDINGDSYVMLKLEYLSSIADKAYRVFWLERKPMHYRDVARKLNSKLHKTKHVKHRSLTGQMSADNRFINIGRGGRWALSNWDLNSITIRDAMVLVFEKAGRALSLERVIQDVHVLRPDAAKKSISTYIKNEDIFVRVENNKFALKKWNLKLALPQRRSQIKKKVMRRNTLVERMKKEVTDILGKHNRITIGELWSVLRERMDCHKYTFYSYLDKMNNVKKVKEGHKKYYVTLRNVENSALKE